MISDVVNLSTGPVGITTSVQEAFQEPAISHRSPAFRALYKQTVDQLNFCFHVRKSYIISGSGTLANEVMLQEIKCISGEGLILSNGEFGDRLINQATRNEMNFQIYRVDWGEAFEIDHIEKILRSLSIKWILFCHCETSTGVINNLDQLTSLSASYNALCFVDCMSTVGTIPLNLSAVAMATASSGKGMASIPGLAIVFSNIAATKKDKVPIYLDLSNYDENEGVPFTISSNLVQALYISICEKLQDEQFQLINEYRSYIFKILNDADLVPFNNEKSTVFTVISSSITDPIKRELVQRNLIISSESFYLKKRGWYQLATFGYYTEKQLMLVIKTLSEVCSAPLVGNEEVLMR